MNLSLKEWAEEDRPREKLLAKGIQSLTDAELLAILIGSGSRNESAVQLSQRILKSVDNNLNQLGKIPIKQLIAQFKGIGEAKAIAIVAALELGKRRGDSDPLERKKIVCSTDIFRFFYPLLADLPHEEFWVLYLNQANKVIDKLKVSQGGIAETVVDIRLIFGQALGCLASGIALCHNHPSGNLQPSGQDDKITKRIQDAAGLLHIQLLDHLILADKHYYSYADQGRL